MRYECGHRVSLVFPWECAECLHAERVRNGFDFTYVGPKRKERRRRYVKRPDASGGCATPLPTMMDEVFLNLYPNLYEHVMTEKWDDGTPREPHTLLIFADAWLWKVMVKDRVESRVAFLTAPTFTELLEGCEKVVLTGKADWRADKKSGPKGRR